MRETSWQDNIWEQARRLLPPDTGLPPASGPPRPDFGLEALDFVELAVQVEQQFGFRFSAAQLADLRCAYLLLASAEPPRRRQLYAEFFAQLMQRGDWG